MKNLFTILLLVLFVSNTSAQDSKFYLGLGAGYATASGDAAEAGGYEGGMYIKLLDMGLRFNDTWGVTLGLASSAHAFEDVDADDFALGLASFAIGPMYSVPMGNMRWDIKPQYAFSYAGAFTGDAAEDEGLDDVNLKGSGWILGNSLVFGDGGKGFAWSIDLDYRSGKITEVDGQDVEDAEPINNFMVGAGVRYNF
jgi:hypothetical protein